MSGWKTQCQPDGTIVLEEPRGYRHSVDQLDARRAIVARIDDAIRQLEALKTGLGATRYLDLLLARRVNRILKALAPSEDKVLERDLLVRIVRDEARLLVRARKSGEQLTAEGVADGVIAKCVAAPREFIPFGDALTGARAELVAALEASSAVGAPRRGEVPRGGTADKTLLRLLRKVGLAVGSIDALKRARTRTRTK